uniref:Dynein light chain n=1 Tax=Chromera velia CCMP2878 TaxID=1169474 RepID=A0A0G4I9M3_9ALVE|mmetsp:Transcript_44280/g.87395  ORF Transcript_44280/g.87395 Transcript_44280/m.87395 type:complete len:112 (+) Transcript_44280:165-500(+)|eukprot:Cvel_12200.t1-p1 / transcript=Cvel_12200.t1 / gene=Cvel_12200 / organism=Chromera_velia_CCMP2878 / gene_product=Dynein light chain, cytoplasmic, putative / transcript_product=Dynein light chain, cytoplasmic, putative / location=Cvel_scaffold788:66415-66747(+) / protein_length=111 / sequence_SO=supercontig / SO=protein_coding / is_pseudo=false
MADDEEEQVVEKKIELHPMKIRHSDLPPDLQEKAQLYMMDAFKEHSLEKDLAAFIKKKMDEDPDMNPSTKGAWQCVVGHQFALSITHERRYVLFLDYLSEQHFSILLFRSK